MGKITDIRNGNKEKVCELYEESDALYLSVKCSDAKRGYRYVKVKISDVVYQAVRAMTPEKRKLFCKQMRTTIGEEG